MLVMTEGPGGKRGKTDCNDDDVHYPRANHMNSSNLKSFFWCMIKGWLQGKESIGQNKLLLQFAT
jgi:hypothetical protein